MSTSDEQRCQQIEDLVAKAGVDVPSRDAVAAVLTTLGEVLPYGIAAYLSANLPAPLRTMVGRHFPVDQLVDRVERNEFMATVVVRSGCRADDAERVITAVRDAVAATVPAGVMNHVRAAIPEPLMGLVRAGEPQAAPQAAEQEQAFVHHPEVTA